MYNPEAKVEVVTDADTASCLTGHRSEISKYALINIVAIPDSMSKKRRSRFLKTNLRRLTKGNYLFIDCDTIICSSLSEIDYFDYDVAMVSDLNGPLSLSDEKIIGRYARAGFGDAKGLPYFNSGVIFAKDTETTHQLYNDWYKLYQQSCELGIDFDQLSLCATNFANSCVIKELSGEWNCQFIMNNGKFYNNAKIMHYFSNKESVAYPFTFPLEFLSYYVRKHGIDLYLENLLRNPKVLLCPSMELSEYDMRQYMYSVNLFIYLNNYRIYRIISIIGRGLINLYLLFSNRHKGLRF